MALVDKDDKAKGGPSPLAQGAVFLVLTLATAGVGWLAGDRLGQANRGEGADKETSAAPVPGAHGDDEESVEQEVVRAPNVRPIAAITTNLAEPSDTWVRAELALVFDGEPDPAVAEAVHQDILAYLRTLRLRQVDSPSGFQYLRADLEERARIRSEGAVTGVLVRTLLFE